jgi:hypothetical protein
VFKGDSADMYAGKFLLVSIGGGANGQACADGERGLPSARAEILLLSFQLITRHIVVVVNLPSQAGTKLWTVVYKCLYPLSPNLIC